MKIILAAPIICFLQFFVFIGQISERVCESIARWIYA